MSEPELLRRAVSATLLPGFEGTTLPEWLASRLRAGLGGVCLFGENVASPQQLSALTTAIYDANPHALIAIDEEGGDVTRLHYATGSPLPGNAILGRIGDLDYTREIARRIGEELRDAGINLDFAPDADINSNPLNPVIGVRSFGTRPEDVAAHTAAWTRGLQAAGVAACAKHFPGHGDTAEDSHLALPVVDRTPAAIRQRELVPFVAAVEAGTMSIMSSHIMLPQLDASQPATFSRAILQGLLRDELGFTGVIVSDALDMAGASATIGIPAAAVRALGAGCDLLCIGTRNTDEQLASIEREILRAIASGVLAAHRVTEASNRVHALADNLMGQRRAASVPRSGFRPQPTYAGQPSADQFDAEPTTADPTDPDTARTLSAFEIKPSVVATLAPGRRLQLVTIVGDSNAAVGTVPWGIAAELAASPARYSGGVLLRRDPISICHAEDSIEVVTDATSASSEPAQPVVMVVVGRDIHRHSSARAAVDRIRAEHADVIVVDMGWPGDDRTYADIATFGASRVAGRALADYLVGVTA